jgi:hypothetical protein
MLHPGHDVRSAAASTLGRKFFGGRIFAAVIGPKN